jgi:hypothetical protein
MKLDGVRGLVVGAGLHGPGGSDPTWSALLGRGSPFLTIPIGGGHLNCYCDGPPASAGLPLRELLPARARMTPARRDSPPR